MNQLFNHMDMLKPIRVNNSIDHEFLLDLDKYDKVLRHRLADAHVDQEA